MSNSAIIRFKDNYFCEVYLHWNGGIESIAGFLKYCELKGYRDGDFARFIQVVGNFFGGGNTIYLEKFNSDIDTDNGIYLVYNWKIVNKKVDKNIFTEQRFKELIRIINSAQRKEEQLSEKLFDCKEVSVDDLKIGDTVFVYDNLYYNYNERVIVGKHEDKFYVNGFKDDTGSYETNINNYISTNTIKRLKSLESDKNNG